MYLVEWFDGAQSDGAPVVGGSYYPCVRSPAVPSTRDTRPACIPKSSDDACTGARYLAES
jgi:hypothetical protein